jgi:hypothetical protein
MESGKPRECARQASQWIGRACGRTPGKRLLSLAFGVLLWRGPRRCRRFILGTGGRKPCGNTQPTMFTAAAGYVE